MNPGYLILYPVTSTPSILTEDLISRLTKIQLLGAPISPMEQHFNPGGQFLQLITFMGCSPSIPLDQTAGSDTCTIRLMGPYSPPKLITGSNTRPPRCTDCRHGFTSWQGVFNRGNEFQAECPNCAKALSLSTLNWRQLAGSGGIFLVISQVFPGEALPVSSLIKCLEEDGSAWEYCYIQDPIKLESVDL